jgi:predicted small secreted protein
MSDEIKKAQKIIRTIAYCFDPHTNIEGVLITATPTPLGDNTKYKIIPLGSDTDEAERIILLAGIEILKEREGLNEPDAGVVH